MKKTSIALLFGLFVAGCGGEQPAKQPASTTTGAQHSAEMMKQMQKHSGQPAATDEKKDGDAAATDDKAKDDKPAEGDKGDQK